jgi:hypothetical protein
VTSKVLCEKLCAGDEVLGNLKAAIPLYLEDDQSLNHFHKVGEFALRAYGTTSISPL